MKSTDDDTTTRTRTPARAATLTIAALALCDLTFLPVVSWAIQYLVHDPAPTLDVIVRYLPTQFAMIAAFVVLGFWLCLPLLRADMDAADSEELLRWRRRVHRLPAWLAILKTLAWVTMSAILITSYSDIDWSTARFFVLGMLLGPWTSAQGLSIYGFRDVAADLSTHLAERGVEPELPRRHIGWWFTLLISSASLSLVAMVGSVGLAATQGSISASDLETFLIVALISVVAYLGTLGLGLWSTVATPLTQLKNHAERIAAHGYVDTSDCVATDRPDELGDLARAIHGMLVRLAKSDAERNAYRDSLESLNRSLEDEVQRRTFELAYANEALEREMLGREQIEAELRLAQKLEAVGQLAAGIAHEINTPLQYVGDNTRFIEDAFRELLDVVKVEELDTRKQRKIKFVCDRLPEAIESTLHGLETVGAIVRAMKAFSHPGNEMLEPADLNAAIESTVTVARNEWKYVADLETDLDPSLQLVPCQVSEVSQVLLNLVINAAHAVEDRHEEEGHITISSRQVDDVVEIRVRDNGSGIPVDARERVFDPFFSTKAVGRGTGQGLSIARRIIVNRHHGTLTFETVEGVGTTFIVRLPLQPGPREVIDLLPASSGEVRVMQMEQGRSDG